MARRIVGESLPESGFQVIAVEESDSLAAIDLVFRGKVAAVLIKHFVSESVANAIAERFWSSGSRVDRPDGVPGYFLGPYHYGKTTTDYLALVASNRNAIDDLVRGLDDPVARLRDSVRAALAPRAVKYRAARFGSMEAGTCRFLAWMEDGEYALAPHDDLGQLRHPFQRDFEIQRVSDVVALNVYPRNPTGSGALRVWNVRPSEECRRDLGVAHTGYPYPPDLLAPFDDLLIEIESGDACLVAGSLVHAVLGDSVDRHPEQRRLLITFFSGQIDAETAVWWT